MTQNKMRAWTEGHSSTEDAMHGLNQDGEVQDQVVQRGVVLLTDCTHCGRQWKGIIPWPEVAAYFLGQRVDGTQATKQGIVNAMPCNGCGKTFKTITDWDEVRRYVDVGVRMGYLNREILRAGRR